MPTNTASTALDRNTLRRMVMDTICCQTADDFLSRWATTLIANPSAFGPALQVKGSELLRQVRQICMDLDKGEATAPKASGSTRQTKSIQVVIFESGQPKMSKGFDKHHEAEAWAARRIVDLPGSHATVAGVMMDRDTANARIYGVRRAQPATKSRSFNGSGPWQKAQQTRVTLPKG
jgi:hypothetical protein